MAVFRVERNTGYTVMSNHHLRNKEYFKILKPKKDAAKGSSSLDDLDFDEDDEETEVVETEQTEQEDDNL